MTFREVVEVVGEVGKAVYSFGLLAIGVIVIRAIPGAREAAKSFTAALLRHAEALTRSATSEDKIDQIAADVAAIKAARIADPDLLDRVHRALEQCEAERSGPRAKVVR
jgi:hypothetical protein